jgi:hypothetical protein
VKPKFVGISLGSIVGAYYLAGNTTIDSTAGHLPYTQTSLNSDMNGFLSVPGARIAYLIQNSPSFAASVNSGLAAKGIPTGSPSYHQFFQATQSIIDPVDPATITTPLATVLPTRLSGRVAIQEATSTAFDASGNPTNGDLTITNPYTRYFGNALGGREVLGAAGSAVGPNFRQLGYLGAATPRIPSLFMFTLAGAAPAPKTAFAADMSNLAATTPVEGYFQFDQVGVSHGFMIDNTTPANTALAQTQMVNYLLRKVVVDPTGAKAAAVPALHSLPAVKNPALPAVIDILGY